MTRTNTIVSPAPAQSVRDVATRQPELVNEVWCRKIFRHILQALERQHALGLPHAPLTPDTIGFESHGDPVLLASAGAAQEAGEAADVQALGRVVHFAITGENVPARLLRARKPAGYSESFVAAVDKCIAPDPDERPQSITELRDLLGIVALGPSVPHVTAVPLPEPELVPVRAGIGGLGGLGKWQRWALIGVAAVVLLATASAFLMLLRGTAAGDNVVLTLPQVVPQERTVAQGAARIPAARAEAAQGQMALPPAAARRAQVDPATPAREPLANNNPAAAPARERPAENGSPAAPDRPAEGAAGRRGEVASYRLLVKPWGTVYVDGVERGVSPPLKRLSLAAGRHTVRVVNPNYRDRVIRVETGRGPGRIDVDFTGTHH
jgi:hypothetical protein